MLNYQRVIIWLVAYPSEKYQFVSWDDKNPNEWKKKIQTTNQKQLKFQLGYLPASHMVKFGAYLPRCCAL